MQLETNRSADNKIVLILGQDIGKNNEMRIGLYPNKKDYKEKIKMTIRKKFAPTDDISKYPYEVKCLAKFYHVKSAFPEGSFFRKKWIKNNYVSLSIPLIPERRRGKLYFRTLSRESYYSDRYGRAYLRFILNEGGERLIQSYQKRIKNLTLNSKFQTKSEEKIIERLRHSISKIENSIRYHNLGVNLSGLLDYALLETNPLEFKKTVRNLAESDEYHEMYARLYEYDDTYEIPELRILIATLRYSYRIKRDFPFLSHYHMLEESLPENFVMISLNEVAKKLQKQGNLGIIKLEELRYMVTDFFYNKIRSEVTDKKREGDDIDNSNNIDDNDNSIKRKKSLLLSYLSEIGRYVQHIKMDKAVLQENLQKSALLQRRYDKLRKEIYSVIESSYQHKEIISIYKQVRGAKIPWSYISDILKSVEKKYGNRFLITDLCFIAKSKVRGLKALLAGNPTLDDSLRSLTRHGLPKHWLSYDLLTKLGFYAGYEKSDTEFKTPRVLRKTT